ncbi:ABC transporter substrate-binding protein, partial [Verticiella sediminum]
MTLSHLKAATGALAIGTALLGGALAHAAEEPTYGGKLEIINYYPTLSALTWDPADSVWKMNNDAGHIYESLIAGDLSKAQSRGGKFNFEPDAWLAPEAQRGELAESWEVRDDPLRVEIKLREGIMFPAKEGVMDARELTAEDVVYSLNRQMASKRAPANLYEFVDRIEATGPHTLTVFMKHYNSEWDYRLGFGYYTQIYPKEVVDKGINDWR